MIKITASQLLKHAMTESKITVSKLAAKYGVSESALITWRSGSFVPKYDELSSILEYLGFDMAELIIELRNK